MNCVHCTLNRQSETVIFFRTGIFLYYQVYRMLNSNRMVEYFCYYYLLSIACANIINENESKESIETKE